jgi:CO dehydrogenase maturation factor
MKLAVSGKGGVGKTLLSAMLARAMTEAGYTVTAVDADPDANLALTMGFPGADKITPISEMKDLIHERTALESPGSAPSNYFKLNPRVDDIPEKYSVKHNGIRLLVMGRPKAGGAGCYCAENTVLAALMAHLLLAPQEMVIMDMAAGIEHLSRGTARAVDKLLIVAEPGRASIETAQRVSKLASDLGIKSVAVVGNKVHNQAERDFIKDSLPGMEVLGFLPYDEAITRSELAGTPRLEASPKIKEAVQEILARLLRQPAPRAV